MSETTISHEDIMRDVAELPKEEEERIYKRGLSDVVAGQKDTPEAQYYISYWVQKELGEAALKASVQ